MNLIFCTSSHISGSSIHSKCNLLKQSYFEVSTKWLHLANLASEILGLGFMCLLILDGIHYFTSKEYVKGTFLEDEQEKRMMNIIEYLLLTKAKLHKQIVSMTSLEDEVCSLI